MMPILFNSRESVIRNPAAITLWVLIWVYLSASGWILSALHQLNAAGYLIALLVGLAAGFVGWRRGWWSLGTGSWRGFRHRFRRSFPLAFASLATLALIGGMLHAPSNYDALAYRIPRILHWLSEGQWHWVHTDFPRLNTRTCAFEWVAAPLVALTKTDRWLFLPNIASLLLLPGLLFSVFVRMGVRGRTAWHWMWLAPSGYCFVLQAGSLGNDVCGAIFALAAVDFALRARASGRSTDAWLSVLSVAMMTSAKTSNLTLGLPWLLALAPAWRLLAARPLATMSVGLLAALVSFLPTAILNLRYCGDWMGQSVEPVGIHAGAPFFRIAINAIMIVLQNFAPPIFPLASAWNRFSEHIIPPWLAERLQTDFEIGRTTFRLGEMQMEESAGLGFGLSALLLAAHCVRLRNITDFSWRGWLGQGNWNMRLISAGVLVAMLFNMATTGLATASRYLTPFYGLLMVPLLSGTLHARIVRERWFRRAACAVFALAGLLLVVTPARPLWPVGLVTAGPEAGRTVHPLRERAATVYRVYGARAEGLAPIVRELPAGLKLLGLVTNDDPETSLWLPFGSRRILHVTRVDTRDDLRCRGLEYVVVKSDIVTRQYQETMEQWLSRFDGEIVRTVRLELRASRGPVDWHLVRLRP